MKQSVFGLFFRTRVMGILGLLAISSSALAQPVFDKAFAPATIGPGSIATLTFTITNNDPVNPVTDLAFTDMLPAGMTVATPANAVSECINGLVIAVPGSNNISFTDGRLSAGSSCTVRVNVTTAVVGTSMNVSGDLTSSAGNSGTAMADLTVATDRPGFSKAFSPGTVAFGDRSTLTFTIDNSLNGSQVFSMNFSDILPVGMVVADPANASTTCNGGAINALPGANQISYAPTFPGDAQLNAGAVCTVAVDVRALARGELHNTSGNLSGIVLLTRDSGLAGDTLTVTSADDLLLTQDFIDDPVTPGDPVVLEYTLTSLNRDFDITDISFTNDLMATLPGLSAITLPANGFCGAGSSLTGTNLLSLSGASLAPLESCTFSVTLQTPAIVGEFPNTVSDVTGTITAMPTNGNVSSGSLFISNAPLLTKAFLNNPAGAGQVVTMEFSITNPSTTSAATDITFTDNIAQFLSGATVSALPAAGFCGGGSTAFTFINNGDLVLQIIGANLPASGSCTFSVDLQLPVDSPPDTYTNTTSAITATVDGSMQTGGNASADLDLVSGPRFRKSFTDDPVLPGDTVTLEFTITHDEFAVADATGITFTDDLNATLAGLSAVGLPQSDICGAGSMITGTTNVTFSGGTLAPNETCVVSLTLQVPAAAITGDYNNTTSMLTATVAGLPTVSEAATDTLRVGGLDFSKEFTDDPVLPGETVTLEFTIANTSPTQDATGMFFTDNLSATLPGLSATGLPLNDVCGAGSQISGTTFLIMTGGNLLAGETCTFSVTLQVPAAANNGSYTNITSSLVATIGGSVAVTTTASDVLVVNNTLLMLTKSFTDDPVPAGSTVSLEFTLDNLDAANTANGIAFTDDLDATLTGLVATGLPANNVCGAGSQISGTSLLTLTGANLPAAGSCTFSVTLQVPAAAAVGTYPNITSQVTGTVGGLPVSGDPAQDELLISALEFSKAFGGPVNTGDTTTLSFTLTNQSATTSVADLRFTDDLDAVVSGLVVSGVLPTDPCGTGSVLSGTSFLELTGGNLPPSGTCTFMVMVNVPSGLPTAMFPNTTSDLFIGGLSVAPPATADLMVNGLPAIDVAPASIDFGDTLVGDTSATQSVTVSNTGTENLMVTAVDAAIAPFMLEASGSCGATPFIVPIGMSCTLDYSYSPLTTGAASQIFTVTSNDAFAGPNTFTLNGNGIQPGLNIDVNPLDFGDVLINTSSADLTVTLLNNGTADLAVSAIDVAADPFSLTGGSCAATPFTLTPVNSCTLIYRFDPTVTGPASQGIMILSDAPTSPDTLTLQGNGVEGLLMLDLVNVNFNVTIVGASRSQTVTLSNMGTGDLMVTQITDPGAPFSVQDTSCGAVPFTLNAMSSCQLAVLFSPSSTADFNSSFDIVSTASNSPATVTVSGRGFLPTAVPVMSTGFLLLLIGLIMLVAVRRITP